MNKTVLSGEISLNTPGSLSTSVKTWSFLYTYATHTNVGYYSIIDTEPQTWDEWAIAVISAVLNRDGYRFDYEDVEIAWVDKGAHPTFTFTVAISDS